MTARQASPQRLRLIMAALVVAVLLSSLDAMMFNTALPTIVGQLRGIALMSWVPTAYLLATALTMPVYGKLGDLFGRKWLLVAALALFLSGSVVGGLAGSMPVLITARAVQGLGSGGLMVLSQAVIADVVPSRERGRYMAVVGSVFIFSSVAGPLLGGWFTTTIGWRWAFWMNVPIAVLAIAAAIALLQPAPATTRQRLAALGVSPIPLRLLADREFVLATAGGMCGALAMFGAAGYLPTYLQMVDGLTPRLRPRRGRPGLQHGRHILPPATRDGDEVVQLYIRDLVSSVAQPVRRLVGFVRRHIAAGQTVTVSFGLGLEQLGFWDTETHPPRWIVEPGSFALYVGSTLSAASELTFEVG